MCLKKTSLLKQKEYKSALSSRPLHPFDMSRASESVISEAIGDVGRWQVKKALLLGLNSVPLVFHIVVYPLIDVDPGGGGEADRVTLQNYFDLNGDSENLLNLRQVIFFFGMLFGCLTSGPLSDRFGRKYTMLALMTVWSFSAMAHLLVDDFKLFMGLQFALAVSSQSAWTVAWIWTMESLGGKWRTIVGLGTFFIAWSLGYVLTALVCWQLTDWREAWFAMSAPTLFFVIYAFAIPESPMWLVIRGRNDEARETVNAARIDNGLKPLDDDIVWCKMLEAYRSESDDGDSDSGPLSVLKAPNARKRSLILFTVWFSCTLTYFGLSLNSSDIGGNNPYLVFVCYGLVEFPAIGLAIVAIVTLGRRLPMTLLLLSMGLSCVAAAFVQDHFAWSMTFAVLGKFFVTVVFQVLYVYTAELYATPMRNTGVAWCALVGRIGGMVSPLIADLGMGVAVFGLTAIFSAGLSAFLPETKDKRLPQTTQEGETFGIGDNLWRNVSCDVKHVIKRYRKQ